MNTATAKQQRRTYVNRMLEFNLSVDASMFDSGETSPAVQLRCPVLSYMNDDEEDSIELMHVRRPSLVSVIEERESAQEGWETLKDNISDTEQVKNEGRFHYVLELPFITEEAITKIHRTKRRHSYKVLDEKLIAQSPSDVLKAMSNVDNNMTAAPATLTELTETSKKSLEPKTAIDMDSFEQVRHAPVATKAQTARGA